MSDAATPGGGGRPGPGGRVPLELAGWLRDRMGLTTFLEGGSYRGESARLAAREFPRVVTIELDPALHRAAVETCAGIPL